MQFVAGSQWFGHLTYPPSNPSEHNVVNQSIGNPEQYGAIVFDVLKAGEASLSSDLLFHGATANDSGRRRCRLILHYCSAEVHADHLNFGDKYLSPFGYSKTKSRISQAERDKSRG